MELASVPGASWATLDAAGTISSGAAGYAEAGGAFATPKTLFEAASLSKVVLAVAVHDMAGEGLVDLARPVAGKFAFTDDAAKVSPSRSTILLGKLTAHRVGPRPNIFHAGNMNEWQKVGSRNQAANGRM